MDKIKTVGAIAGTIGVCAGLDQLSYGGLLAEHSVQPSVAAIDAQAQTTQAKALAMLASEGIPAEAHTYPTTQVEMVLLDTNSFVGIGTYLPMEYQGAQPEYQGAMAFRPYGVSGIANGVPKCLIIDGNPKTEPLVRGC